MTRKASTKAKAPAAKSAKVVKLAPASAKRKQIATKAGRASGDARTSKAERKVRAAMQALEKEIAAAGGVENLFPKGLTKKAVAEKAHINPGSLYTEKLKTLGEEVSAWVELQNGVRSAQSAQPGEEVEERQTKSRSLATRYSDLHKQWKTVLQDIRDTKLAMMKMKTDMEEVHAENAQLIFENASFKSELDSLKSKDSKVVRMPRRR